MKKLLKLIVLALVAFGTCVFLDSISQIHEVKEDDDDESDFFDPFDSPDSVILD